MSDPVRGSVAPPSDSNPNAAAEAPDRAGAAGHAHILLEAARQLGSSLEPNAILARTKESLCRAMPCNGVIVSSLDREAGLIRCAYAWAGGEVLDPATLPPLELRPDAEGMQTQVIRTGRPMMFSDVGARTRDPRGQYYEVEAGGAVRDLKDSAPTRSQSALMSPLILEGEVVGVLQVMSDEPGAYGPDDLELLEGISLLLAIALENARLFRRLEDELEERRRTERHLRATEAALLHADRRKDEFLATLGHELRTPLNPIRSAVELLQLRAPGDPETQRAHDVIRRQVVHLARLMDDLLDVSRITRGKLDLRRSTVSLDEVLQAAVESIRPLLDGLGQSLTIEGETALRVDADPVRLAQVFSNLFDNASKYTPPASRIAVGVERAGDRVAVSVRDAGRGIAAEHLPHVFDLFYQAGSSAEGGLGIGLTLVKQLVDLHGGSIDAESDGVGRGSTFTVRLPLASGSAPSAARDAPVRTERAWRVLVADDNRDSAESMGMLLGTLGHEVDLAFDGEEALVLAARTRPDAIVLDIGMPILDGYEVARRLRAQPWGRDVVLIAATGWGQERDRRRSAEAGFDAHLVKPVDHLKLLRLMAEIAESRA